MTEAEKKSPFAALWLRSARTTGGGTTVNADIQNTVEGKIIVLTNLVVVGSPGAGQFVSERYAQLLPPNQAAPVPPAYLYREDSSALAINLVGARSWQGEVALPSGWWIRATVQFDGGAINQLEATAFGYAVPTGSLQLL